MQRARKLRVPGKVHPFLTMVWFCDAINTDSSFWTDEHKGISNEWICKCFCGRCWLLTKGL